VVFLTTPLYDSGEQSTGALWPEDDPQRVQIDNALIRGIHGPGVSVFNLQGLLSPGGTYRADVAGIDMRCTDGVHLSVAAGEWLAPRLFPRLMYLGRLHQVASPAGSWPGPLPPPVPGWWHQLTCG
jgi:hypothetical protein